MRKYYRKKIKVNKEGNYVIAYIFKNRDDMHKKYDELAPYDKGGVDKSGGVCINREYYEAKTAKQMTLKNKLKHSGFVLTCTDFIGAGVVSHEFMHAVLFAHGISKVKHKKQYPIVIKDMEHEEVFLYALTDAVSEYYRWYWSLKDKRML